MVSRQTILNAVTAKLSSHRAAVITLYEMHQLCMALYVQGEYDGRKLVRPRTAPKTSYTIKLIKKLEQNHVLRPDDDFTFNVFRVSNSPDQSAEEICCYIDPFCYISHLSAMHRYSLTNRTPAELHLTTPANVLWTALAENMMGDAYASELPKRSRLRLQKLVFPPAVRERPVTRHESKHPGNHQTIRDSTARIATIGQTFADMLEHPSICGGMSHVIEVWEEHATRFREEIISVVEQHYKKLVKVRAGYLLSERLHVHDDRIENWRSAAQRGSSQKLDPERPFAPTFSEKWMLSLNV